MEGISQNVLVVRTKVSKYNKVLTKSFVLKTPPPEGCSKLVFDLYEEFTRISLPSEKIQCMEQVIETVCKGSEADFKHTTELLFAALLQLNLSDPMRKKFVRCLHTLVVEHPILYKKSVDEFVESQKTLEDTGNISNIIALILDNQELVFPKVINEDRHEGNGSESGNYHLIYMIYETCANHVKFLWNKITSSNLSSVETNSILQLLQIVIKNVSTLLQRDFEDLRLCNPHDVFSNLLVVALQIARSPITPLDLRVSCGLMSVKLHMSISQSDIFLTFDKILRKEDVFEAVEDLDQLALLHGILCNLSGEQLFNPLPMKDYDVADRIFEKVLNLINATQNGTLTVLNSRILNHLMLRFQELIKGNNKIPEYVCLKYSIYSPITHKLLNVMWILWDHFLDSVKHLVKETFEIFIKCQEGIDKDSSSIYLTKLGISLLKNLSVKHAFSALSCLVPLIGASSLLSAKKDLPSVLVKLLADSTFASYSSGLLEALFTKHFHEADFGEWENTWFSAFFKCFTKDMLIYGYENLLHKLLVTSPKGINAAVIILSSSKLNDHSLCLLIMCTKIALKLPPNKSTDSTCGDASPSHHLWKNILPYNLLEISLSSADETLQILSFNLLCESSKSTELFEERELKTLIEFIDKNCGSKQASIRQKFVSNVKKILNRINKGIPLKVKLLKSGNGEISSVIASHEEFVSKLFELMSQNLCWGSNFPRRHVSLLILQLTVTSLLAKGGAFHYLKTKLYTSFLWDNLILCLADAYENNKIIALQLLNLISLECHHGQHEHKGRMLLNSVWRLSSSTISLDSLSASYILNSVVTSTPNVDLFREKNIPSYSKGNIKLEACWCVLRKLQKEVDIAQVSLFKAASKAPMYGLLLSLRHILSMVDSKDVGGKEQLWSEFISKVIRVCIVIAEITSPIVKNSSPEGCLLMELNLDSQDLREALNYSFAAQEIGFKESEVSETCSPEMIAKAQAVSAQMLLLCGWRSIKETSLLFGFIVHCKFFLADSCSIVSYDEVELMGNFFMNQLTETKHRGAFEQAYFGFGMVCDTLWKSHDSKLSILPEKWLKDTLKIVQDKHELRVCPTRRSAGLPFIIQAIVSNEPSIRNGFSFKFTMETLLKVAGTENELEPRIHAFNILRALYRDTRIGEAVIPFVSEGVKMAIEGHKNVSWGMRNSATLLLAALVTRMFGVKRTHDDLNVKNSISALVFFKRYPDLYDFFLDELKSCIEGMDNGALIPSTYPTLLLLARLAPTSSQGYATSICLTPFIPYVLQCSFSPIFQLRSLAARALIPLITPPTIVSSVEQLCRAMTPETQNQMHGILLCFREIVKSYLEVIRGSEELREGIEKCFITVLWVARETNPCFVTRGLATEICNYLVSENLLMSPIAIKALTASCFSLLLTSEHGNMHSPGMFYAMEKACDFFLNVNFKYKKENTDTLLRLLDFSSLQVKTSVLKQILRLKDIPEELIKKVISIIKTEEDTDTECNKLLYDILSKICSQNTNNFLCQEDLKIVLLKLISKCDSEYSEELVASMITSKGHIIRDILKGEFEGSFKELLELWCEAVLKFSSCEYSTVVRLSVTSSISNALVSLIPRSQFYDVITLPLIKVALDLLVDDDVEVQKIISVGVSSFLLKHQYRIGPIVDNLCEDFLHPPAQIIDHIFLYLASEDDGKYLSLLINHALKENPSEEFGLSQEEDRAFEKGERSLYREDIFIAKSASEAVLVACTERGISHFKSVFLQMDIISEQLLLPIPNNFLSDKKDSTKNVYVQNESCDIYVFLKILCRDIEYILDTLSSLRDEVPFEIRQYDLWCSRLARRALIWNAFKHFISEIPLSVDKELLDNIKFSLMKTNILNDINQWLIPNS